MLVVRYFCWVGGALVGLLLLTSWYYPLAPSPARQASTQASTEDPIEQSIHIRSERKLPAKVVIDTSIPTIIPPSRPTQVAIAPPPPGAAARAPIEARAEMKPAAPPKRVAKVRRHIRRPDYPMPSPSAFAFANPMAPSWPFRWR